MQKYIWTIIIIGLIVFSPTVFNGFVMDDQGLILNNANVHSIGNLFNFFRGSIFDYGGSLGGVYYRPMMSTSFSFIYTFFGSSAFFYHLFQLFLHITNALLFFFLLKKFVKEKVSLFLTLIFLTHPIQVESVVYIAALQEILFFSFGVMYLLLLERKKFAPIFILLSLLSKETGILFAPLGILYSYFYRRKNLLYDGVGVVIAVGIAFFMRFVVAGIGFEKTSEFVMMRTPFLERMINVPSMILYYLQTLIFPYRLVSVQSWLITKITVNDFFLPLLIDLIFFGTLFLSSWMYRKKWQPLLFFWVWFMLGILLHIQIVPLDLTVADRWFYFPLAGLLGIVGVAINQMNFPKQTLYIAITIIALLSVRSFVRVFDWHDTRTLAMHDLRFQKNNYRLLSALGGVYLDEKNYEKARVVLEKSVALYPHWGTSEYNLGVAYHMSHQTQKAKKYYIEALRDAPEYILGYENMAILLYYNNELDEAITFSKKALKKFPNSLKLWQVVGYSSQKLGHTKDATEAAQMIYLLTPKPQGMPLQ